jgi:hypothetical protein
MHAYIRRHTSIHTARQTGWCKRAPQLRQVCWVPLAGSLEALALSSPDFAVAALDLLVGTLDHTRWRCAHTERERESDCRAWLCVCILLAYTQGSRLRRRLTRQAAQIC